MQQGTVRRKGLGQVVGRWRADERAIVVDTNDPELKRAAEEVLESPQAIPVHGSEHHEFAGQAEPLVARPSSVKFLALFALEMEERGYEVQPEEEEA
jgi:hypothetical protein